MLIDEDLHSPELLGSSIQALLEEDPESALTHLQALLKRRSPEVRLAAVGALGRISSAVPALRDALEVERNELVLSELCELLGYARDDLSLPRIKALAKANRSNLVRAYAVIASADIEGARAVPFLKSLLSESKSRRLRSSIYFALLLGEDKESLGPLLAGLESRDEVLRCRTANYLADEALVGFKEEILPVLRSALAKEDAVGPRRALQEAIDSLSSAGRYNE